MTLSPAAERLGVDQCTATEGDISRAYRRQALQLFTRTKTQATQSEPRRSLCSSNAIGRTSCGRLRLAGMLAGWPRQRCVGGVTSFVVTCTEIACTDRGCGVVRETGSRPRSGCCV